METPDNFEYLVAVVGYDIKGKEELVQLLHKGRDPQRVSPLRASRIRHIYFTNPSEIPRRLSSQTVPMVHSNPRATNAPAPWREASQIEKVGDEHKARLEEPDLEPVDDVLEEPESQELVPATDKPTLTYEHEPTEQEILAAMKIQGAYRRYRQRCDAQTRALGKELKAQTENIVFAKCLKNVYASTWRKTPYRTLYLWALPRLVVCLDKAMAIAHEFKNKTKRQLSKDSNDERLEELGLQLNNIK